MNAPYKKTAFNIFEGLLIDVARRVQLSPAKHEIAEQNFRALCGHVDRDDSPLAGKVVRCYPAGSFAIGAAVLAYVTTAQHDVDVVLELDYPPDSQPRFLLKQLYNAINGTEGSAYHGKVRRNSRCVTVTYKDGTSVDLMPIARLPGEPERAGNLFHFKEETGDEFHKPVNPWAFAERYNARTELMTEFAKAFRASSSVMAMDKALTEPLPEHVPLSEKSPRTVAVQLAKRARDISYRQRGKKVRKPPSVVIAGMSLEMGPVQPSLTEELIALVTHMERTITAATHRGERFRFFNPAYPRDEFTDRWPEDISAQRLYSEDLRRFRTALCRMRDEALSPEQIKGELEQMFGEAVAGAAIEDLLEKRAAEANAGTLRFGNAGRILPAAGAATGALARPARGSTFQGGPRLPK